VIDKELKVSKIKDGTVIDHIRGGYALDVVRILGISGKERRVMTIAINVPSRKFRVKDVVKIEGKALDSQEVNRIALVAPHATINIVRDYEVIEKLEVKLPSVFEGILRCINPCCISNSNEPVTSKFYTKKEEPVLLKCYYCGFPIEQANILKQL
jgi:aspartate carbamoyltransferase regulatory subunit